MEPIITEPSALAFADGGSFCLREWQGSGPAVLHVHREDDEAWHVLEGTLRLTFGDRQVEVAARAIVFVPAGVAPGGG